MNFIPDQTQLQLWDTWVYLAENDDIHLFYLANKPGGAWGYVGHAVSRDWLHWTDLPEIILRGEPGTWDAGGCGTGMVFKHDDGRYYMSYTGALSVNEASGLFTSRDLITWEKLTPKAPYWTRQTTPPYEEDTRRVAISPAWRDAFVTRNPQGEWEAVCSARVNEGAAAGRACLARCKLMGLDHWVTMPPLAHTGKYSSMEVPEIWSFGGKYWVVFSTGSNWGVRLDTESRRAVTGTFYVCADKWEGPYYAPKNNLLIGAGNNQMHSYVGRLLPYHGQYLLYHHYAGNPTAMGLPKVVNVEGDQLYLSPWDGLKGIWQGEAKLEEWRTYPAGVVAPGTWKQNEKTITGHCAYGSDALIAEAHAPNVDMEGTITLKSGRRAGIAVGMRPDKTSNGFACLLDAVAGEVTLTRFVRWEHANGLQLDARVDEVKYPVRRNRTYRFRLLRRDKYLEFFLDNRLVFSSLVPEPAMGGAIACVLESASAAFTIERVHILEPLKHQNAGMKR